MIQGVTNMVELYAWKRNVLDLDPRGVTSFKIQMDYLYDGTPRGAALSAWMDLMPEHEIKAENHSKIYNALFRKVAQTPIKPEEDDRFTKFSVIEESLKHKFPSVFEKIGRRKSFAHLIQILERNGEFSGGHEAIADMLFEPYIVIDGGGQMNLAFNRKDIESRHLDEDDLDNTANYAIIRALKEGKNVQMQYVVDGLIKTKDAFTAISKEISKRNPGASMWTGLQHPSDGNTEGMEVVIVSGDMEERNSRKTVGRWVYEDKDENGDTIWTPLRYDKEQSFRVLSAFRRGNFMDIDNQDDIYDQVKRWIDEGPGWLDTIPSFLEEVITAKYQPFNIGKFEYNEVVLPFWNKYGPKGENLSRELFAAKWEEERLERTHTFEEKFFDLAWKDLLVPFQQRTPIGVIRHGARPDWRGIPGGRYRIKGETDIEKKFLLENSPSRGTLFGKRTD